MRPSVSQYAQSLEELTHDATAQKIAETLQNFFGFLKRKGEMKKIKAILKQLENRAAEKSGRVTVKVVTAHEISQSVKDKLKTKAEKLFPDKKILLEYAKDADVIGGVRFRTDEVLYDATIANELHVLKQSLQRN